MNRVNVGGSDAFVREVIELERFIRDAKQEQPIDQSGYIFYESPLAGPQVWSGPFTSPAATQSVQGPTIEVTATSPISELLLADLILIAATADGVTSPSYYIKKMPSSQKHIKKWVVFVGTPFVANKTWAVNLSVKVAANIDVAVAMTRIR